MPAEVAIYGRADWYWSKLDPISLEETNEHDVPYIPEALAESRERAAAAKAFDLVLEEANRLYQDDPESNPSNHFYIKLAVESAREKAAELRGQYEGS